MEQTLKFIMESRSWPRDLLENLAAVFFLQARFYCITARPVRAEIPQPPFLEELFSNLREAWLPRPKDYSAISAAPVHVRIQKRKFRLKALTASLVFHVVGLYALNGSDMRYFFFNTPPDKDEKSKVTAVIISPKKMYLPPALSLRPAISRGGGGRHEKSPPRKGQLPRFAPQQILPPKIEEPKKMPQWLIEPTLEDPVALTRLDKFDLRTLGDPAALARLAGEGAISGSKTGLGTGIGTGQGPGYGSGSSGGRGNTKSFDTDGISPPQVIFKVKPSYTPEASAAQIQGKVTVSALVLPDGSVQALRVIRGLGYGLDEKAMEAVRKWRFRPGLKEGQPIAVAVSVEVHFSL
jgi:protein TonB